MRSQRVNADDGKAGWELNTEVDHKACRVDERDHESTSDHSTNPKTTTLTGAKCKPRGKQ